MTTTNSSSIAEAVDKLRDVATVRERSLNILAAVEAGYTPTTPVVDQPVTIGGWSPRNYSGNFSGQMTLAQAVAQSTNTVAAYVADQVGRDAVARAARRLGITSEIGLQPSMALGAVEVSPLEMAQEGFGLQFRKGSGKGHHPGQGHPGLLEGGQPLLRRPLVGAEHAVVGAGEGVAVVVLEQRTGTDDDRRLPEVLQHLQEVLPEPARKAAARDLRMQCLGGTLGVAGLAAIQHRCWLAGGC